MGDSPLNHKREWITLRETVRMGIRKNELLSEMMTRLQRGRVFKLTYRSRVLLENWNILEKVGNSGPALFPHNLVVRMNLENCTKEANEIMVKMNFEKIKNDYGEYESVYTDASVIGEKVGVGVYLPRKNIEKSFRVDEGVCIMNAELIGMLEGIKLALRGESRKIIIFSDSQCGMLVLRQGGGREGNVYVDMIYECVRSCLCEVVIQWIPSHRQIEGNERADMLAKRGCDGEIVEIYDKKDARDVLRELKENLWNKWMNEYENLSRVKGKKYRELCEVPLRTPFFKVLKSETRMLRTIERIRMNHGNWRECLFKRQLVESSMCDTCSVPEDIEHLVLQCPRYRKERAEFNILKNANSLTQIMKDGGRVYMELYKFVRMSKMEV